MNRRTSKSISIGQVSIQGVNGMAQQPQKQQFSEELIQKIMENLALSIAKKIVDESAETLILPETA